MVNDLEYGNRDKRGDWRPFSPVRYAPVFIWPAQPAKFLKWFLGFPGYLWPWNAVFAATGAVFWYFLVPPLQTMATLSPGWIGYLFVLNATFMTIWFGSWHFRLYVLRKQDTKFKFNSRWMDHANTAFLFKSQNKDNIFWTLVSALPIFTAWEVLMFWSIANGNVTTISLSESPIYFLVILLLVPIWLDFHFHFVHRTLHWPPLYRWVHTIHHNNVNPGPWSGLAMHPIEHIVYFSAPIIFFVVPFHPVHLMFVLLYLIMAPARGHAGFGKIVIFDNKLIPVDSLDHYLHHKYHECNYSEGVVPWDKWLGSFHDGSAESEARMMERFKARNARKAERREARAARKAAKLKA